MAVLGEHKLRIALDRMDVMKPDRGDLTRAHVLWLGPALEGEDARRLKEVCGEFQFLFWGV
jgi:activating signal cointegrator complex subunit 1